MRCWLVLMAKKSALFQADNKKIIINKTLMELYFECVQTQAQSNEGTRASVII